MATNFGLDDVRVFTTVVQAGSFTAAAARLGVPKSSVSRRVGGLEEQLGARLLNRTTRKLSLTDAGQIYYRRAASAIEQLDDAERAVHDLQASPRGVLRVTVPADLASTYFAGLVCDFQATHPEVEVILWATGQIVDLVADGFDLAIRAGSLPDSSLLARKLVSSHLALYAAPRYLDAHARPACPAELRDHRCLAFGTDGLDQVWRLAGPRGVEEVAVHGPFACNDLAVLRHAAVAGMGIVTVPWFEGRRASREGLLEAVLPDYELQMGGALYAVYPSARHLTPKVRAFIDFAEQRLRRDFAPDA